MNSESRKHFEKSHHVLYHIFRFTREHRIDEVAEKTKIPESTLQKYATGVTACPVEVLHEIFLATKHPLLRKLLTPEGWWLVPKAQIPKPVDQVVVVENDNV